jgi:hypothetical protein
VSGGNSTESAGGVQLVGTPGRPAGLQESQPGEHDAGSVLCLDTGAGPGKRGRESMPPPCPPARPVRFDDPARNAAYWARIERIVAAAPPLSDEQRAIIRTAFHQPAAREAA